jgi:hypothetical protein
VNLSDFARRADELIALAEDALRHARPGSYSGSMVHSDAFTEFRAGSLSFIERVFGKDHPHYKEFDSKVEDVTDYYIRYGIGILRAVKGELVGGWLVTTRGLVSAEVFADFLEMSEHLLDEKYKDSAAVMIGSVLEEHLRQLASKAGVPLTHVVNGRTAPSKADALNADLTKAKVYGVLDQKAITSWLDLRNRAAHGKYGEYSADQVTLMLAGVRNFLVRVPL